MRRKAFDVFISHASEDKKAFAEPLAEALRKRGLSVWFDKFELIIGDSLRQKIEEGLAKSRFGIVIYSHNFFKKRWTKAELNGLFAREMSGKKLILPILHELSIGEVRKRYPIQADKFSLSSAMSLQELCDALLKRIKPELLKLDTLSARGFDASDTFVRAAASEYPAYEFSMHATADGSGVSRKRVEMRFTDSTLAAPPTFDLTFVGTGIKKASEFMRTGKPQMWQPGEFRDIKANIPLFPTLTDDCIISVGPGHDPISRPIRLEIGLDGRVAFGLMNMTHVRSGSDEGELLVAAPNEPLSISIVASRKRRKAKYDFSLSWKFSGHSASRCQKTIEAVDRMLSGDTVRIIDLREERPTIELPTTPSRKITDPFGAPSRRLYSLCGQIEKHFHVTLVMRESVTEGDKVTLHVLDCLINGKDYGSNFSTGLSMIKSEGNYLQAQLLALEGHEFMARSPVVGFDGEFELFGTKMSAPMWGTTTRCAFDFTDAEKQAFISAATGFLLKGSARALEPTKLIWMPEALSSTSN